MPGAANAVFAVNAKTKNAQAIRFVRFVASPAFQNAFAKAYGSLPAYPSKTSRPDPGLALFVGYQRNGKTYPFPDQLWPNPRVQNAHLTGLQSIFAGEGTVAEMLRAMDRAYRAK
jgi:raffinose/stachyose/melibiose transport system substrate-binding protein